jgi:hypothetical protein
MSDEMQDRASDEARAARVMEMLDRRPVRLRPGLRTAVMARVRAPREPWWTRAWHWMAAPVLSPLAVGGGLAAAAALLILLRSPAPTRPAPTTPVAATASTDAVPVRLVFIAPGAASVAVTGDFASWSPSGIPLVETKSDGVWRVDLELKPGLHHYVFIVNGTEWRPDPNAGSQVDDGFGQKNSVLLVPSRRSS